MKYYAAGLSALLLCFGSVVPPVWASGGNVTNQGNNVVLIRFLMNDGSYVESFVNPNQTTQVPDRTSEVKVTSTMPNRGDERVSVTVVQEDGTSTLIRKYGDSVRLGSKQKREKPKVSPSAINSSNLVVNLIITGSGLFPRTQRLDPHGTCKFESGDKAVAVAAIGNVRGDEKVEVDVTLDDGSIKQITTFGGRTELSKK